MRRDYFVYQLDGMNVEELWLQQEGAACHTTGETIELLKGMELWIIFREGM